MACLRKALSRLKILGRFLLKSLCSLCAEFDHPVSLIEILSNERVIPAFLKRSISRIVILSSKGVLDALERHEILIELFTKRLR